MATKRKAPKQPKKEFVVSLTMGKDLYSGSGATPFEALNSLPQPPKIMAKGKVTVSAGDETREIPFTPIQIKRLFLWSRGTKEVIAKQLFTGLIKQ